MDFQSALPAAAEPRCTCCTAGGWPAAHTVALSLPSAVIRSGPSAPDSGAAAPSVGPATGKRWPEVTVLQQRLDAERAGRDAGWTEPSSGRYQRKPASSGSLATSLVD
jgi:hypothetical protein